MQDFDECSGCAIISLNHFGSKFNIADWNYFQINLFNEINIRDNYINVVYSENVYTGVHFAAKTFSPISDDAF